MLETFSSYHPVLQAFLAGLFTWGCTIVGSSLVLFFKSVSRKLLDVMSGFAGGTSSVWICISCSRTIKGNVLKS